MQRKMMCVTCFIIQHRLAQRIGWTVNHLLSHTGIQFILHDIQENELEDDLILVTPRTRIGEISARFNISGKLDIYFLIVFDESFAWGGADQQNQ